ncbi:MAG TPA: sugar-binding domain-containing protein, partial [Bacteroidales bacterium]
MKRLTIIFSLLLSSLYVIGQVSFGDPIKINNDWKFSKGDFDKASQPEFDDAKWRKLDLPHDWSVEGPLSPGLASATGYLPGGIAWYRKSVEIPADKKDKKVYIYFEGVYRNAEV